MFCEKEKKKTIKIILSFIPYRVIQSEAKNLGYISVNVLEILPPFGRLNDN